VSAVAVLLAAVGSRLAGDLIWRVSVTTGWLAGGLLLFTLVLGPANLLRRRPNPLSSDLRRDVGIWAGIVGVAHAVLGIFVHFRGHPWTYFVWDRPVPLRYDPFGAASWTGLGATIILVMLTAISNDFSLRRLGAARWKRLQRWNYAAFLLIAVHGVLFQVLERRNLPFMLLLAILLLVTITLQVSGVVIRRRVMNASGSTRPDAG